MAASLGGCTADVESETETELRWYEGYGDLTIFMGTQAGDDDCDLWDFLGSGVQGGSASGAPGAAMLDLDGATIRDASGAVRCEVVWDGDKKLVDLQSGETVLTSSQVFLIDGDWSPNGGTPNWQAADYTFRDSHVREGGWWGEPLLTADTHIGWIGGERQLLIGALIEGLCGAPGLDAVPTPAPGNHPEG